MEANNLADAAREVEERVETQVEELRERAKELNGEVIGFVREHPGFSLGAVLALGYIVGRIVRR